MVSCHKGCTSSTALLHSVGLLGRGTVGEGSSGGSAGTIHTSVFSYQRRKRKKYITLYMRQFPGTNSEAVSNEKHDLESVISRPS